MTRAAPKKTVTERLRDDILAATFPPGERLIELQLTERYAVGRAAVRAAFVELATEGLVVHESNRGATVRRVTIAEAIEIIDARTALEGLVARLAAVRATKAERTELRTLITSMVAAVKAGDQKGYGNLNRTLHRRLREMSRHRVIDELVANLRNRAAYQQFRLAAVPGRSETSLKEHRAIVRAVVAGDGDAAEAAMRRHLDSVADVLRRWEELGLPG